ncbi:hypothetical protein O2W15_01045 [Modestobacter sp. VKM Ac-2979]|uniref:DUF6910 family protein n=1 Tax=unclassified Modestobacter TaxID=2643866 RepID=UPI0022AB5D38|nr:MULTISPECIES: hypothetical protein [unclassified Modestobacter]MCZ2810009.1 hypothetical protein [Modestobacter sp. VKM Ac-2979]MCZ2842576.1 hypothetical protein [Modestobacter sp. VKM Ac-2980]
MRITVDDVRTLTFDDGTPVTAASAIAPLGEGWLVAPDDSTIAAWVRPGGVTPVRVLPPVEGLDHFSEPAGTKHLKPDLEVACPAEVDGEPAVLLLGSGSTPRRMRGVLVRLEDGEPVVQAGELGPLYATVGQLLEVPAEQLNLEGASRHGDTVRWFHRGNLAAGAGPASVDVPLADLVAAVLGRAGVDAVPVSAPRSYDLGRVAGVGLAVTDAIALPDGRTLLSAAAEDTPNAVDDGPVVAAALALVDGETVLDIAAVPEVEGRVHKVEGLALREVEDARVHVLAVVDDDVPGAPSVQLELRVEFS